MGFHVQNLKLYLQNNRSARLPDGSLPTAVYTTDDLIAGVAGVRVVVTQTILLTEKVELPINPSMYRVCISNDAKPIFIRMWEDKEKRDTIHVEHLFIGINPRIPLKVMLSPVVIHISEFVSNIEDYIIQIGHRKTQSMPFDPFLLYTAEMMFNHG